MSTKPTETDVPASTPAVNTPDAASAAETKSTTAPAGKKDAPLSALDKLRKALAAARSGDLETAEKFRLTDQELDSIRFLNGRDGRPLVNDRKRLWQMYVYQFSEKRAIEIPFESGEKPIMQNGQVLYPTAFFCNNGVPYIVPKGTQCEVPLVIYETYKKDFDIKMAQVLAIDVGNGMKSDPQSFTQVPQMLWEKGGI